MGSSLEGICVDLQKYKEETEQTLKRLEQNKEKVIQNKDNIDRWDYPEIILFIKLSAELFEACLNEFNRLVSEIPEGVKDYHVDMIADIIKRSLYHDDSCVDYKREYIRKYIRNKVPDQSMRPLIETIYGHTRDQVVSYKYLADLNKRLTTYIVKKPEQSKTLAENNRQKRKPVFPVPDGTKWEDISISLLAHDMVSVKTLQDEGRFTYHTLGMVDGRKGDQPTEIWNLLKVFAVKGGYLSSGSVSINDLPGKAKRLNSHFKKLFGINESIFTGHYKKEKGYRTRIRFDSKIIIKASSASEPPPSFDPSDNIPSY